MIPFEFVLTLLSGIIIGLGIGCLVLVYVRHTYDMTMQRYELIPLDMTEEDKS